MIVACANEYFSWFPLSSERSFVYGKRRGTKSSGSQDENYVSNRFSQFIEIAATLN
jgi:hypothetical protein